MRTEIPVTILSGSLGAGKTTLLNHLLRNAGDRDVAVLVNDMGDVNVDAELVADNSELDVTGGVTELSNGCICCELQDDLETAVVRLAGDFDFDHLVVEASGISEPEPVARLFTTGSRAAARYTVDAVVAVVDTRQFVDTFAGEGTPERRATDEDARPLSDLLIEQVEFANVVLLNKVDLCTEAEIAEAESLIHALRPDAEIHRTERSAIDPDTILGASLFDPRKAGEQAGWQVALAEGADEEEERESHDHGHGGHDHAHPDEVYGVSSFTYRARRPFHPDRVADLLGSLPDGVVRAKGTLWVAGRELKLGFNQAGPSASAEATEPWVASLPEADQELYRSNRRNLDWDDEWGDRKTELVVIGTDYDEEALRSALDDALLSDDEMDTDWDAFENPFPDEVGEEVTLAEPTRGDAPVEASPTREE